MNELGLRKILINNQQKFGPIIQRRLLRQHRYVFDLSSKNAELKNFDFSIRQKFVDYIFNTLKRNNCRIGLGQYNEDRIIYNTNIFKTNKNVRSIHLGVDLWLPVNTAILAPLTGRVYSLADNLGPGDYGPTIILSHQLSNITFYTLYGHLSRQSLRCLKVNQKIGQGKIIGRLGNIRVNGNWPPHLHFQIISNMLGQYGDFYGVCSRQERRFYTNLCPNPNLILKIR